MKSNYQLQSLNTLFVIFFVSLVAHGQNLRSISDSRGTLISNTLHPDTLSSSAALEIRSTDKVFYPPRMSSNAVNGIVNPRVGATVYDTDMRTIRVFNGTRWENSALPKSAMILSEYYPNDTLTSAGYQYAGNINVDQTSVSTVVGHIRTIPADGAPSYAKTPDYFGVWGENKLFITRPDNSIHYYDAVENVWNAVPPAPALNSGASIVYRGTLTNKYVLVASDNTVYVYSIGASFWSTFTYPTSGVSTSITKANNRLVFWEIGTNTIRVFTGNSWYILTGVTGLPAAATTLEYNDNFGNNNIVFLWNANGIINGKMIRTDNAGTNPASQSTFTNFNAPMSRDNYGYKIIGNKLVIWGGTNGGNYTNTGSIYNLDFWSGSWTTINTAGAPAQMTNIGVDGHRSNIVVYGYFHTGGGVMKCMGGIYNPVTMTWSLIPNSTASGYSPRLFVYGNYLYFWDGYIPDTTHIVRYFEPYNLDTNQWMGFTNRWFGFGVGLWTGKYFIEWGGYFSSNSTVTNNFSSGGNIYGTEGFPTTKRYHLYKKQ